MKFIYLFIFIVFAFSCTESATQEKFINNFRNSKTTMNDSYSMLNKNEITESKHISQKQNDLLSNKTASSLKNIEIPIDGIYVYKYISAEHNKQRHIIYVRIIGDSIYTSKQTSIENKNSLFEHKRVLLENKQTKEWLISNDENDNNLIEVGECTDSPNTIDFIKREIVTC